MKAAERIVVGVIAVACCAPPCPAGDAKPAPVAFAGKPAVSVQGSGAERKWAITFAGSAACDATVSILDKGGKVIRHLAGGMLGANAPEPFQRGALAQKVEWDGTDDAGRRAPDGCAARVSLGLGAEFVRILCPAPKGVASRGPIGMAVDRNGELYVTEGSLFTGGVTTIVSMKSFDGQGDYRRTVIPFRADWPAERVSMVEFLETLDGRRVPLSGPNAHRPYSGFVPGNPRMTRQIQAITADGRMFLVCGEPVAGARRILSVGMDGSAGKDLYVGPELPPGSRSATSTFLALSPDDRFLYVAGVTSKRGVANVVYRAWIADGADPVKPFLGVEYEEGGDEKHFKDPRGIGVDSRGRLYVCDYMNDRIQVFEAEGTFVKSLPVTGPEQVLVHPKTGALYVLSVADRGATEHYGSEVTWEIYQDKALVKYASLDDTNEVARLDLPKRKRHMHDVGPILALDASQASPVLWIANVGRQEPDDMLWKVVDSGPTLAKVAHNVLRLNRYQTISPALAADRANNELLAFGTPAGSVRIDPASGATRKIELAGAAGSNALARAGYAAFGHDGLLYVRSANPAEKAEHAWLIRRFDRTGALVPFGKAGEFIETNGRRQGGSPEYVGSFCVGADGRLYVVGMASRQDFTARVDVYGADGALLTKGLVQMTDNPGGVRVDAAGRVYVSDTLRPKGRDFPDFYPADPRKHFRTWYGSVLGFPPGGGSIRQADAAAMTDYARGNRPVKVEGALWSFYGVSPMPQQAGCLCVIADFDVDGWGRVFVPDVPGNCVAVLDRNGNVIMRFGSYGNADATGAGSAVPRPPIPLWFPERVAALDGDAFVVDSHNSRIVQVRLTGAAVEDVKLP